MGPDVVNTGVGSSVDFDDVEIAILNLVVEAIDGVGKDTSNRGFASAAGSDKEVGVGGLSLIEGFFKGSGNMLLPDYILEFSRAVLTIEDGHL